MKIRFPKTVKNGYFQSRKDRVVHSYSTWKIVGHSNWCSQIISSSENLPVMAVGPMAFRKSAVLSLHNVKNFQQHCSHAQFCKRWWMQTNSSHSYQQLTFTLIDEIYSNTQFFQLLFSSLLTLSNVAMVLYDLFCVDMLLNPPNHITGFDIRALQNNISQSEGGLV